MAVGTRIRAASTDSDSDHDHLAERRNSVDDTDLDSLLDEAKDLDSAGEDARFLPLDMDPEPVVAPPTTSKQRYVILMCVQFLFMIEVSGFIMEPPLQQIMEDFICHEQYPDHVIGNQQTPDDRCKEADVQGTLAMTRSWMMTIALLVPLLVQIPYGIAADRYGRRPILFLGLLGLVLTTSWNTIVLLQPNVFTTWYLIFGPIPTIIGGGAPAITAMVWTILTDTVPVETRTTLFYQMHAMMLILSAICRPIAAWLLSINPWLPMWIGLGALVVGMFSSLLIPETLHFHKAAGSRLQNGTNHHDVSPSKPKSLASALASAQKNLKHVWSSIFKSRSLMLLIAGYGLCYPFFIAYEMNLLQYTTARYKWQWSTATYITTIHRAMSVIVLLALLPFASKYISKRWGLDAPSRDLVLARGSVSFLIAGNILTAVAAAPWLLITSLVILSFGNGFYPQIRALLAALVEADSLATLNTFISTVETVLGLISMPAMGWLLSTGIKLGGFLMGLPYMVTSIFTILSCVVLFMFQIPPGIKHSQDSHHY
ncbi:MFS efflux pump atnC [Paramyrothecium foliicola]|nr:MFS efflux pump atnC [Paramyrothecium foliicola]